MPGNIVPEFTVSGGTPVYFLIAPYKSGNVGTYGLDITAARVATSLVAPTGMVASEGIYTSKIRFTWNNVSGATHYRVAILAMIPMALSP